MWHFDMFVTLKVFKLIGPSNDGRRHGRGTYLLIPNPPGFHHLGARHRNTAAADPMSTPNGSISMPELVERGDTDSSIAAPTTGPPSYTSCIAHTAPTGFEKRPRSCGNKSVWIWFAWTWRITKEARYSEEYRTKSRWGNFLTTFLITFLTFFWQLFDNFLTTFLTTFWHLFDDFFSFFFCPFLSFFFFFRFKII
jgi:hypothetical protein